ncbi:helix-turn-helix domain-containing protein [Leptolyngbya sp. FACHB-261]|uniref:helix-turn-helix domain-containing protein n=1 Tax=Leptolyngbya sp. FACHB-261 TaxID=2692806 RepID=UPI0016857AA2|nr:helix-turn-helix domain-containing protein [Leptolyngbya sp. FACHB-261]MBD2100065.1 helix-turn-helix domain-containing protein [Leptolyngbya sp. FACHB-261]
MSGNTANGRSNLRLQLQQKSDSLQTIQVPAAVADQLLELVEQLQAGRPFAEVFANLHPDLDIYGAETDETQEDSSMAKLALASLAIDEASKTSLPPFLQHIELMQSRLAKLFEESDQTGMQQQEVLPDVFRGLGIASEELTVAVETLCQQNEELAATRQAIELERQRYQELFDYAPDGYFITDTRGNIEQANAAAARQVGVLQKFLVGKPLTIYIAEVHRPAFRTKLSQLAKSDWSQQEWQFELQPRDRQPVRAAIKVVAIRNASHSLVGLRWLIREISSSSTPPETAPDSTPKQERPAQTYMRGELVPLNLHSIWQVQRGVVKLSTLSDNGEEILIGLAGSSTLFGPILTTLSVYQAVALSDTVELVAIPIAELATSPDLVQMLFPQVTQRLHQAETLLAIVGYRHVPDRLCRLLQLFGKEFGRPVEQGVRLSVRLTHEDLASACSTTRVTVTRLLRQLQKQGKIDVGPDRHITLKAGLQDGTSF